MARVLYITSTFPCGPGESFLDDEVRSLCELGNELYVVPMFPRGEMRKVLPEGVECVITPVITMAHILAFVELAVKRPTLIRMLLKLIIDSSRLTHSMKNLLVLLKAAWTAKWAVNKGIEHIHVHWLATTSTMGLIIHTVTSIPWSITAHRWDIVDNNMIAEKVNSAEFVRVISEASMNLLRSKIANLDVGKTLILHMGVRLPSVDRSILPRRGRKVFLCPASLLPVKGHIHLIEAAKILKKANYEFELWLAGDGPLRARLQEIVREKNLDDVVRFLGHVAHHDLLRFYDCKMIFCTVLPSIDLGDGCHEGIPVSLMEAMAYSVPVISTNTGGIPELVEGAGFLVEPEDPEQLASAMEKLILDEQLAVDIGSKGRRRVEKDFDANCIARELTNLFETGGSQLLEKSRVSWDGGTYDNISGWVRE